MSTDESSNAFSVLDQIEEFILNPSGHHNRLLRGAMILAISTRSGGRIASWVAALEMTAADLFRALGSDWLFREALECGNRVEIQSLLRENNAAVKLKRVATEREDARNVLENLRRLKYPTHIPQFDLGLSIGSLDPVRKDITQSDLEERILPFSTWEKQVIPTYCRIDFSVPDPSCEDLLLASLWAGNRNSPLRTPVTVQSFVELAGNAYEAARLLSARLAELVSIEYFQSLGMDTVDVSSWQLETTRDDDWKTHDLLVNENPIDVKNARRAFSSRDRYSEFTIPRFKSSRNSRASVAIATVLSDYVPFSQYESGRNGNAMVLGLLEHSELKRLAEWIRRIHGGYLDFSGLVDSRFFPGWLFEYPKQHYSCIPMDLGGWRIALDAWRATQRPIASVPRFFLPLISEEDQVFDIVGNANDVEIWREIRDCIQECGWTRRAAFAWSLGRMLHAVVRNDDVGAEAAALRQWVFPPVRDAVNLRRADIAVRPWGLHDPLKYVASLFDIFSVMSSAATQRLREFRVFRLAGSGILQGSNSNDEWWTLIAYCGGWNEELNVKCGKNPIYLGANDFCTECRRLVCGECSYCNESCPQNQVRRARRFENVLKR